MTLLQLFTSIVYPGLADDNRTNPTHSDAALVGYADLAESFLVGVLPYEATRGLQATTTINISAAGSDSSLATVSISSLSPKAFQIRHVLVKTSTSGAKLKESRITALEDFFSESHQYSYTKATLQDPRHAIWADTIYLAPDFGAVTTGCTLFYLKETTRFTATSETPAIAEMYQRGLALLIIAIASARSSNTERATIALTLFKEWLGMVGAKWDNNALMNTVEAKRVTQ